MNEEERKEEIEERLEEKKEKLEEKIEDYEERYEDLKEEIQDTQEEIEDIDEDIEDLEDEMLEVKQEKIEAGSDISRHKLENRIARLEEKKARFEEKRAKLFDRVSFLEERASKAKEAIDKAMDEVVRMNISMKRGEKDSFKDLADNINTSVSEIIRSSVGVLSPILKNLKNIKDLEKLGDAFDKWGENLEEEIKRSGIEDLGKELEMHFEFDSDKPPTPSPSGPIKGTTRPRAPQPPQPSIKKRDMERIKKRIYGLIKLQGTLPISKLAQVLSIPEEKAENLIYELVAEGIEGKLEGGVFKFTNPTEEVIETVYELIERNTQ